MKKELYNALDICLQAMEEGASIDECLADFPNYVDELRPLLETARAAKSMSDQDVPGTVLQRNRTRLLQQAVQLERPSRWSFSPGLRLATVSLALLFLLFVGGNGLVTASSSALPGDRLYSVKRTVETIRIRVQVDSTARESLEERFRLERANEASQLIKVGRSEKVKFEGVVHFQSENLWMISGVPVLLLDQTRLDGLLVTGSWVEVEGLTRSDGFVAADRIRVREPDEDRQGEISTPDATLSPRVSQTPLKETREAESTESKSGKSETSTPEPNEFELEGVLEVINGPALRINNKEIVIDPQAEIKGTLVVGVRVRVKGYMNSNGMLVALKVEVRSESSGSGSDNDD